DLITQPSNAIAFLSDLYGIQFVVAGGGTIDPFNAQEMLRFTGLSRVELGQLVQTRFVTAAGAQPVEIRSEKTTPDSVQNDIERIRNLTADVLDRLHRFTRLLRHLPWSVPEFDLVLAHSAQTNLAPTLNEAA